MAEQERSATCAELAELLPAYLNGTMEAATASRFKLHLSVCPSCRQEEHETRTVWALCEGHLPVELLLDYAFASPMSSKCRAMIESHLVTCDLCSNELDMVRQESIHLPHETPDADLDERPNLPYELPADLNNLLEEPRYWDEMFLGPYLEHCDDVLFRDLPTGLDLAEAAPKIADKIPERGGRQAEIARLELCVRANAVYGGALRLSGRLDEAETAYQIALQICEQSEVTALEQANLHHRLAVLRITQRRFDEAVELCREAVEVHRSLGHDEYLGEALVVLGTAFFNACRYDDAIPCFGESLQLTKNKTSRTYHAAIHNLAAAFSQTRDRDALKSALRHIRAAKRLLPDHRRSLP